MDFSCLPGTEKYRKWAKDSLLCLLGRECRGYNTLLDYIKKSSKIVERKQQFSYLMTQSHKGLMLQFSQKTWDDKQEDCGSFSCTILHYGKHSGPENTIFQSGSIWG